MLKEATMREAMFNDPERARFMTPAGTPAGAGGLPPITPAGGFQTPPEINEELARDEEFIFRMNQELREYEERQNRLSRLDRSQADDMLSTVSQEELPQGVSQFMIGHTTSFIFFINRRKSNPKYNQWMDSPPNVVEEEQQPASSSSQIPPSYASG